jgi:serine protease Do
MKGEKMSREKMDKQKKYIIRTLFILVLFITAAALVMAGPAMEAMAKSVSTDTPGSFSELAKQAAPSVVNISSVIVIKTGRSSQQMPYQENPFGEDDPFGDFFRRFFQDQIPRDYRQTGLGTGFIIDKDGYILTNNHMVEGADEITVTLADKREFTAEIIGRDSKTDLALIKIEEAKDLQPLPLGDSDKLEVGDWVIAIGNPFGLENTVTAGIVSAKYRQIGTSSYDNYIQTDASINRGNSGGPLLNINGEVIGINAAIFSQTGGSIGIGFAIPINMAKDLLPQLKKGKVVRGWLGVYIQGIDSDLKEKLELKDENGALVADVTAGGPAEDAGFQRGDVIVAFNGEEIKESQELPYIVGNTPVGEKVPVDIIRDGRKMTFHVKLGELPDDEEISTDIDTGQGALDLGMSLQELTPNLARQYGLKDSAGLLVVSVDVNSSAYEAGLQRGDIILEIDQEEVSSLAEFNRKIAKYGTGDTILFYVKRQNSALYLTLEVW